MSKVYLVPKVPNEYNFHSMTDIIRQIETQLNNLSENRIEAKYNARAAVPTTGIFKKGDFIPNSDTTELGSGGSKYVLTGWICVDSGEPGTFRECRVLTGN